MNKFQFFLTKVVRCASILDQKGGYCMNKLAVLKKLLKEYDKNKDEIIATYVVEIIMHNFKGENIFLFLNPVEINAIHDIHNSLKSNQKVKAI